MRFRKGQVRLAVQTTMIASFVLATLLVQFAPGSVVLSKKPCIEGCTTAHLTANCWHPCVLVDGECINPACTLYVKSGDTYLDECSCGGVQQQQWYEYRKYDCNNDGIADCKCEERFFTPKKSVACLP